MLGRKFTALKWFSLVILTIGVVLVQCSGSSDSGADDENDDRNRSVGLVAVLSAACTSGFAGVYFEKILKGSEITLCEYLRLCVSASSCTLTHIIENLQG